MSLYVTADITSDLAMNLLVGDFMAEFGEVTKVEPVDVDLIRVEFFDGLRTNEIKFHEYEDVELLVA